jgi:hypothetical protein
MLHAGGAAKPQKKIVGYRQITDTALFRNPYYHTHRDTADKLDFEKMARVVDGSKRVVISLAEE